MGGEGDGVEEVGGVKETGDGVEMSGRVKVWC